MEDNKYPGHGASTYDQITDNIWIGSNMCCDLHNKKLIELGFDADVDMEEKRAEEPPHTQIYLWFPTPDHSPPTLEQLSAGVAAITSMVKDGLKIYVHCKNGHGRGPTMVAAYLISTGMGVEEAFDFIRSKRSSIHPRDVQIKQLEKFSSRG
jgi:protein-tyrosine phosphatase